MAITSEKRTASIGMLVELLYSTTIIAGIFVIFGLMYKYGLNFL